MRARYTRPARYRAADAVRCASIASENTGNASDRTVAMRAVVKRSSRNVKPDSRVMASAREKPEGRGSGRPVLPLLLFPLTRLVGRDGHVRLQLQEALLPYPFDVHQLLDLFVVDSQ